MRRPSTKNFFLTPPGAIVDNAALTTNVIDTKGVHLVEIEVLIGATDIAMAALKVQESDTKASATALTSGADITGLVAGTSTLEDGTTSTLPSATDDNTFHKFIIPTQGRKRYLDLVATGGDGTAGAYITAVAILHYLRERPNTAAKAGVVQTFVPQ